MKDIETLFCLYRDSVYRLALSYTRSPQEAEDICQTVFLKLLGADITPGKEKAWLMQVTANACRSLLRSHWWQRTVPLEDGFRETLPEGNAVLNAVMELMPKYRVVVYLHYYEGCSTEEIGRLLHISRSAVTTRLNRARNMLKDRLQEDGSWKIR